MSLHGSPAPRETLAGPRLASGLHQSQESDKKSRHGGKAQLGGPILTEGLDLSNNVCEGATVFNCSRRDATSASVHGNSMS